MRCWLANRDTPLVTTGENSQLTSIHLQSSRDAPRAEKEIPRAAATSRNLELVAAAVRRKSHGTPVAGSSSNNVKTHSQQKSSVRMMEEPSVGGGRIQATSKAAASHKMDGTSGELAY